MMNLEPEGALPEPRFIAIARIVRPQGRRGEVVAELLTDFPERFQGLKTVFLGCPEGTLDAGSLPGPYALERAWLHKGRIVLKLLGVGSISEAEALRGRPVLIPYADRVPLADGAYYWMELEGCRVALDAAGEQIDVGTVSAIEPAPGVALLHVTRPDGSEILIPFARDICREIDPEAKLIVIEAPEGLLELNA